MATEFEYLSNLQNAIDGALSMAERTKGGYKNLYFVVPHDLFEVVWRISANNLRGVECDRRKIVCPNGVVLIESNLQCGLVKLPERCTYSTEFFCSTRTNA